MSDNVVCIACRKTSLYCVCDGWVRRSCEGEVVQINPDAGPYRPIPEAQIFTGQPTWWTGGQPSA